MDIDCILYNVVLSLLFSPSWPRDSDHSMILDVSTTPLISEPFTSQHSQRYIQNIYQHTLSYTFSSTFPTPPSISPPAKQIPDRGDYTRVIIPYPRPGYTIRGNNELISATISTRHSLHTRARPQKVSQILFAHPRKSAAHLMISPTVNALSSAEQRLFVVWVV